MGYFSTSLTIVMPAMAHSSCRCVGEPGGVTMSQSRMSCGGKKMADSLLVEGERVAGGGGWGPGGS